MSDLISRQAAIDLEYIVKNINGVDYVMLSEVQMKLRKMPSAERERGKWIKEKAFEGYYRCSVCGRRVDDVTEYGEEADIFPFCHCGADMQEGEE